MAVIKREAVKAPVVRKETVPVASLKGSVVVRGLLLSEMLTLSSIQGALRVPLEGESQEDAHARAGAVMVAKTLHLGVVLADSKPMWTEAEWNAHGSSHLVESMQLFSKVNELSGNNTAAAAKN
jgi:hypothetical protein